MSSSWAFEAARNSSEKLVPGTSRHIASEMKTTLLTASNGISSLNSRIVSCVLSLNGIIDEINAGNILLALDLIRAPDVEFSPEPESSLSRTHSIVFHNLSHSDHFALSAPLLSLERSIKRELRTATPVPPLLSRSTSLAKVSGPEESHAETFQPSDAAENPPTTVTTTKQEVPSPTVSKGLSASRTEDPLALAPQQPKSPFVTTPAPTRKESPPTASEDQPDAESKNSLLATAHQLPSHTHLVSSTPAVLSEVAEALNIAPIGIKDDVTIGLSPAHIPRGPAPMTSPNVDLSFIPIANSINPYKFDDQKEDHSSPEPNLSFQAISTAIRKSFAGKLSMGHLAARPLYTESTDQEKKSEDRGTDEKVPVRHTLAVHPMRPKPPRKSSRRSSVFVSLPEREPIIYSRHSTVKKLEKTERSTFHTFNKASLLNGPPSEDNKSEQAELKPQENKRLVDTDIKSEVIPKLQTILPRSAKLAEESPVSVKPEPFRRNPISKLGVIPKISPTITSFRSRSRSPPTRHLKHYTAGKSSSRSTVAGSPRHESFSASRSPQLSPSRNRSPIRNNNLVLTSSASIALKLARHSSRLSNRSSPINRNINKPKLLEDKTKLSNDSAVDKTIKSRETIIRNKFLTTKLNPERPPQFQPLKTSARQISPIKKTAATLADSIVDRLSKKKPESSTRQKQKITISLSHKSESLSHTAEKTHSEGTIKSPTKSSRANIVSSKSPARRGLPRGESNSDRFSRKSLKRIAEPNDFHIAPRKRAIGNAVPLPDAARGILGTRDRPKESNKDMAVKTTPIKPSTRANGQNHAGMGKCTPETLPDIPSEDDMERGRKYIKSWAETPEILRTMKEKQTMNPVDVFGAVPVLKIDEVFDSLASRQRGQASPTKWSP